LAPFSRDLVEHVFLDIEQPEHPIEFPVTEAVAPPPETIGEFYRRLKALITDSGQELFAHPSAPQVLIAVDDDQSIEVTDAESAARAIDFIVAQGEGTKTTPFDDSGAEPAHYYRFKQIVLLKTLRPDHTVAEGFSFGPPDLNVNEQDVYPVKPNLRIADIPIDSPARMQAEDFARRYTMMLVQLHQAFNGDPTQIDNATNTMRYSLGPLARQLVKLEIAPHVNAGPTFEYLTT
jgi:Ferritin-like